MNKNFIVEDRVTGTMIQGRGKLASEFKYVGYAFASLSDVISKLLKTGKIEKIILKEDKGSYVFIEKKEDKVITYTEK